MFHCQFCHLATANLAEWRNSRIEVDKTQKHLRGLNAMPLIKKNLMSHHLLSCEKSSGHFPSDKCSVTTDLRSDSICIAEHASLKSCASGTSSSPPPSPLNLPARQTCSAQPLPAFFSQATGHLAGVDPHIRSWPTPSTVILGNL